MNHSDTELNLIVNGRPMTAEIDIRMLLLEALRERFGVKSPKAGCMTGDCGACTVLLDGAIEKSCLRLAVSVSGATVHTLEGDPDRSMTELKQAFWDEHGFQCGYCLSGMLWSAWDLLRSNPSPSEADVRRALAGNLCRCTGYAKIVAAVLSASAPARAAPSPAEGGRMHRPIRESGRVSTSNPEPQ